MGNNDYLEKCSKIFKDCNNEAERKAVIDLLTKDLSAIVLFKKAIEEITEGKNLIEWGKEVDSAIAELNSLIEKTSGKTEGYEKLKNELYALKYLIAEKR